MVEAAASTLGTGRAADEPAPVHPPRHHGGGGVPLDHAPPVGLGLATWREEAGIERCLQDCLSFARAGGAQDTFALRVARASLGAA